MTRLDEYKQMVGDFHRAFGHPIAKAFNEAEQKNFPLRVNLIAEEFREYNRATKREEVIDALADLLYVLIGTSLVVGITPADWPVRPLNPKQQEIKIKPELTMPVLALIRKLEERVPCYRGLWTQQTELYHRLENTACFFGFDLLEAVRLVHASNMTKLWKAEEIQGLPEDLFEAKSSGGLYIVTRKLDGKVVKSPSYSPVNLTAL